MDLAVLSSGLGVECQPCPQSGYLSALCRADPPGHCFRGIPTHPVTSSTRWWLNDASPFEERVLCPLLISLDSIICGCMASGQTPDGKMIAGCSEGNVHAGTWCWFWIGNTQCSDGRYKWQLEWQMGYLFSLNLFSLMLSVTPLIGVLFSELPSLLRCTSGNRWMLVSNMASLMLTATIQFTALLHVGPQWSRYTLSWSLDMLQVVLNITHIVFWLRTGREDQHTHTCPSKKL